ncbi:MAG TPA: DUF1573 domain-containing protein [Desulfomonilaceae bacterium]|nr:DUF1573 domain-containing protein [Desulfomonilaceae bacterium]
MRILRMVLFLILTVTVPSVAAHGPNISFDKEEHDYGKVSYGDTVTDEFVLTNTGDQTLVIDKLESSCGCTKAVKGSSEVPPNGHTKIVAEFDTTGLKAGKKQKTVSVYSNDPQRPVVKLTLLADVVRDVNVEPPTLATTLGQYSETVSFPLKITNSSDKPVTVQKLMNLPGTAPGVLQPGRIVVAPHSTVPFHIVVGLKEEPGRLYWVGRYHLLTDHPREKEIDIRYLVKLGKP